MTAALTLNELKGAVQNDAAIRGQATLQPAGGDGDKVFPPTHSVPDENRLRGEERRGAKYARERRRIKGTEHEVVVLDSVQSQANRMEEALQHLWKTKQIVLPVIQIDFGEKFPDLRGISSLTAPHRISDALLRDSLLEGTLFRYSELGKSFTDATPQNAAPLFKACPTALVFGLWDSTGPKGGLGFKLARNLTSEIVGVDAVFGTKTSSRIDPAGIVRNSGRLYEATDAKEQWTLDENAATKAADKNGEEKPVLFKGDGKPSSANHGNIPPTLELLSGGITIDHAKQTVVLSLGGLRRLCFGSDDDDAARTVLAALGLLSVVAAADRGYDLRSRCQLVPKPGGALAFERVGKDGTPTPYTLCLDAALNLFCAALDALPVPLTWRRGDELLRKGEPLATLVPTPKLQTLIAQSRTLAAAGEADDDEA